MMHCVHGAARALVTLWVSGVIAVASAQSAPRQPARVQPVDSVRARANIRVGSEVRPDTVTVADPFALVVSLDVPVEAAVQWPAITDTAANVVMRSPTRVTSTVQGARRVEVAEYALAAWDIGRLPIGLGDATVRLPYGVVSISLREARVAVKTVLPLDTSLHVPKPARPLFPRVVPWWELWWLALLIIAGLAALWWAWRRLRRKVQAQGRPPLDVYARAMHEFNRLQRLGLADVGERGRAVALAVEILRTYLSARSPEALLSRTSLELVEALGGDPRVPHQRLAALLDDADVIKFAHRGVTLVRARELQDEARAIVEAVERAGQARLAAEAAARLAHERAERAAKLDADDAARRRSKRKKKAGAA
jgi:hypothetical protein